MHEEIILHIYRSDKTRLHTEALRLRFENGKFHIADNQHVRALVDGEHFYLGELSVSVELPKPHYQNKQMDNHTSYRHTIEADPMIMRLSELAKPAALAAKDTSSSHDPLNFLHLKIPPANVHTHASPKTFIQQAETKFDFLDQYFPVPAMQEHSPIIIEAVVEPEKSQTDIATTTKIDEGNILRDLGFL